MGALRFGPQGHQLFGYYHAPIGGTARATSVLLCNPFGQEALRAQRMFRMLAERLARNEFHVLRFDYYATGDSDGECEEADLDTWTQDILLAHEQLAARSTRCAWIGLGIGGALAARASLKLERPLELLALWEPVLDGERYLAQLGRMHDPHFPRETHGLYADGDTGNTAGGDTAWPGPGVVDQILGFPLSAQLKAQFAALSRPLASTARAQRVTVLGSSDDPELKTIAPAWLRASATLEYTAVPPWSATDFDDIVGSAVVYNDVINGITAALKHLP